MGHIGRHLKDLESGDFVLEIQRRHTTDQCRDDFVDDEISEPTHGFGSPNRPSRVATSFPDGGNKNPLKHPIAYIRKVASKRLSHSSPPTENSNLLRRFEEVDDEEEEDEERQLQPSPTFFLSQRDEARDSPTSATYDSSGSLPSFLSFSNFNKRECMKFAWCGFVLYVLFGSFTYSVLLEPSWSLLDSMYFSVTLFTTIGYGNSPTSGESRTFTCIYASIGCTWLFAMILFHYIQEHRFRSRKADRSRQIQVMSALGMTTNQKENDFFSLSKNTLLQIFAGLWLPFGIAGLSGWSFSETMYFIIHTIFFIGQGDVTVTTQAGKLLAILWTPIAVSTTVKILFIISSNFTIPSSSSSWGNRHQQQLDDKRLEDDLRAIGLTKTDTITRAEFLELALVSMNIMEISLVQELRSNYDHLLDSSNIRNGKRLRNHLVEKLRKSR